jgi:hypothetical protein
MNRAAKQPPIIDHGLGDGKARYPNLAGGTRAL